MLQMGLYKKADIIKKKKNKKCYLDGTEIERVKNYKHL